MGMGPAKLIAHSLELRRAERRTVDDGFALLCRRPITNMSARRDERWPARGFRVCRALADRLRGRAWILPLPAVVDSAEVAAALKKSNAAADVFSPIDRVSVAVFGVGSTQSGSSAFQHGLFDEAHLGAMVARGAAGSICARFYDSSGAMLHSDLDARTLSIDLSQLASAPRRFGVAFGPEKVTAIYAAIRSQLVNHLATDSDTAFGLLALADKQ
jgi:deoxyribonucleoside regulator